MPVKINEIVQALRLRERFGVFGAFQLKLDETVVPVALVEDATGDVAPEDVPCVGGATQAFMVANYSNVGLQNPAGSDVEAILDEIWVWGLSLYAAQLRMGAAGGATVNPAFRRGQDWTVAGIPQVPVTRIRHQNNVAVLGNLVTPDFQISNLHTTVLRPDITLQPGDDIHVVSAVVNVTLSAVFMYRQRTLV